MKPHTALTIAGFDGSGGAGIQACIKTFSALGCYGMSVLTALPIQNTRGVKGCYELPVSAIKDQLEAIFEDIHPDAIQVGMLFNAPIIEAVAHFLQLHASHIPIVLDPVMIAKSGHPLLQNDAISTLKSTLIPITTLITPNLPEAEALTGQSASTIEEMQVLVHLLSQLGAKQVLLKGGHLPGEVAHDLLMDANCDMHWFKSEKIHSKNTHGTGCTLSAAITAFLAQGMDIKEACARAKTYLYQAILAAKDQTLGLGNGPVHHFYHVWPKLNFP
jgi:hydroxymethylpyrimidine/phosphomethylpyrimidine kinase